MKTNPPFPSMETVDNGFSPPSEEREAFRQNESFPLSLFCSTNRSLSLFFSVFFFLSSIEVSTVPSPLRDGAGNAAFPPGGRRLFLASIVPADFLFPSPRSRSSAPLPFIRGRSRGLPRLEFSPFLRPRLFSPSSYKVRRLSRRVVIIATS